MAKKEKPVDTDSMEAELRFMGTYGDAITLLMAFFVMLYAISQVDAQKFQLLVSGLADPFKNTAIEDGLLDTGTGIVGSAVNETVIQETPEGVAAIELVPAPADASAGASADVESEGDSNFLASAEELQEVRDSLFEALQAFGLDPNVSLDRKSVV